MDERVARLASLANIAAYNAEGTKKYIEGAPHIKHDSLRLLYGKLVVQVYDEAKKHAAIPRVLDLGAGEGSVTLPFLELGANVTAIDISSSQLSALQMKCERFGDRLKVHCEDVSDYLKTTEGKYDIIVANSFLHHVPDYLGMIKISLQKLTPGGQFFSFQDPCRYDSLGSFTTLFGKAAYLSWRITRGDVVGGLKRRYRRSRGVYLEDSIEDNAEYHVIRNGVDQDAISQVIRDYGVSCKIVYYHSTQSRIFQSLGTVLGMNNTFAVIARKAT